MECLIRLDYVDYVIGRHVGLPSLTRISSMRAPPRLVARLSRSCSIRNIELGRAF